MDDSTRDEIVRLQAALAAQEALRAQLGDALVDATIGVLAEKLAALGQAAAQSPQRKQVTVLFADLVGFTPLAERLDPEDVSEIMGLYFQYVTAPILERGGSLEKYIGDAVMAVFGLPTSRETDAAEAVRAGLGMQQALDALNDALARERGLRLAMRVGINTGLVLSGRLAGDPVGVTVIGDTVNLASRLEGAAPPGGVLISQATYDQVRGLFAVEARPPLLVKGKAEPLQTYRVLGAKPRAFHMATRGLVGITTRTVGRERELGTLQAAYHRARAGGAVQWITLSGEAGVGKSRVLAEFEQWLELQPESIWYLKGRAWPHTLHSPYFLLRDILSFRFQLGEADPPAEARHKLAAGLSATLGENLGAEAAAFVGQLIGLDFRDSPWIAGIVGDTRQIHGRAVVLLRDYLARASAASPGPAILLLEDLQWADAESLALLSALLHPAPAWRMCVVGTARPDLWERHTAWVAGATGDAAGHHCRLDVNRLPGEHAYELARELLQKLDRPADWLVALLLERGGGNPYFVEELVKWLIDRGVIRTGEDRWQVGEVIDATLAVPETIQGVLQARLERLAADERGTLQHAAIIGRAFWEGAVAYIGQAPVPAARWAELEDRDLVYREPFSQLPDEKEYHFRHALLRDVVYEYTLKAQRRLFHRRAAEWLIQKAAARADEWAVVIAAHWEQAGERGLAATWYGRAAERAQATYAPQAAVEYYQRAVGFAGTDHGGDGERMRLLVAWHEGLGWMMHSLARTPEAVAAFQVMLGVAREAQDLAAQARALNGLSQIHDGSGDHRAALEYGQQAAAVAEAAGPAAGTELAVALLRQGWALYRLGQAEAARDLAGRAARLSAEQVPPAQIEMARSLNLVGMAHDLLGNAAEALRYKQEALAWCREAGDRRGLATMLNNLGVNAEQRLDLPTAATLYEESLTAAQEIGHRDGERLSLTNRGGVRADLGQYAAAEMDARRVLAMKDSEQWFGVSHAYLVLAEALRGQGRLDEAFDAARKGLQIGQDRGQRYYVGLAWRALAKIAAGWLPVAVAGERHDAASCFAHSARILAELGARVDQAQTLQAWAEHELAHGDRERGAALAQQARELFGRLGLEVER